MEHDLKLTDEEVRLIIGSLERRTKVLRKKMPFMDDKTKADAERTGNRCYELSLRLGRMRKDSGATRQTVTS